MGADAGIITNNIFEFLQLKTVITNKIITPETYNTWSTAYKKYDQTLEYGFLNNENIALHKFNNNLIDLSDYNSLATDEFKQEATEHVIKYQKTLPKENLISLNKFYKHDYYPKLVAVKAINFNE